MKANQDIRDYMADHGITQRMLSKELGVPLSTLNGRLLVELPAKDKEVYLNAIDSIANEVNKNFAEEAIAEEVEETTNITNSTKFQIGDRVKIPAKAETIGIVTDIWSIMAQSRTMYEVAYESNGTKGLYAENQLDLAPIPIEYRWEANIAAGGNVAVVTMHAKQGDKEWVYARGHAHILHDGEVGMAQAVSFAARRMFESLDSKQENKIYLKGGNA